MKPTLFVCLAVATSLATAVAQGPGKISRETIVYVGATTPFAGAGGGEPAVGPGLEVRPGPRNNRKFVRQATGTISPSRVPAVEVPRPAPSSMTLASPAAGFMGITHLQQRAAGTGIYTNTQFSLEPPDQCLAVGNGFVLEAVNTALRVRDVNGTALTPVVALNQFFGLAPSIIRSTPPVYGPFTADPKCYYDKPADRWFLTLLSIAVDPATGAFGTTANVLIAVSATGNPAGAWNIYSVDTTNASHPGCPCFGDQPLIGTDAHGFYVTTNEFPIATAGFNGAQIYAISKARLAAGDPAPPVVHISGIPLAEGPAYSVQPATTPPGSTYDTARGGTAYFMSALDFVGPTDNRIAVWALTNTSSLATTPAVALQSAVVNSQSYGFPPDAEQKPGPLPLADFIFAGGLGVKAGTQHLPIIAANDDRMQQTVYAAGLLWSALNTSVKLPVGPVRTGSAWFIVQPTWNGSTLGGEVVKQGYVAVTHHSILYPAIGVNTAGKGVMGFSIVGESIYPSVGYVTLDAAAGASDVSVVALGAAPADGFTGYPIFQGRPERWGDYSAAVADETGNVWFATEYIPNAPRTILANWGTFIAKIIP